MKQKRNLVVIIAALILVLTGGYFLYAEISGLPDNERLLRADNPTSIPYAEGAAFDTDAIHDFTVSGSAGDLQLFDHLGEPILLHFWRGESDEVLQELKALDDAYRKYGEDLQFVIVHAMGAQTRSEAEAIFKREELTLPLYFDEDGSAMRANGATQAPATYFVDADGFIAASSAGSITEETLRFGIALLMAPAPLSSGATSTPAAGSTAEPIE